MIESLLAWHSWKPVEGFLLSQPILFYHFNLYFMHLCRKILPLLKIRLVPGYQLSTTWVEQVGRH
jgi:hypothetical protein